MKHFTIRLSLAFLFISIITFEGRSQITGSNTTLNVVANTATVVDGGLTIIQTGNIADFNVQITDGYVPGASGDILSYTGSLPSGVTSNFNSNLGILHFIGTTSAANWQTLLRTVTLKTTSTTCYSSKRSVTFVLGNAYYNSSNDHYYKTSYSGPWSSTKSAVESTSYYGRQGYFATITSSDENNFILGIVDPTTFPYIGASDDYQLINAATGTTTYANQTASEGNFFWVTGPEAGTQFTSGGSPVSGKYTNWLSNQPDDYPNAAVGEENFLQFYSSNGGWNDCAGTTPYNSIVEYGGMSNDIETNGFAHTRRNITVSGAPSGVISGDVYVCSGSSSATLTLIPPSGGYSSIIRWESSVDKYFTNPSTISNTTTTLNLSGLTVDLYYRAIVSSSSPSCSNIATPGAKVVLNTPSGYWTGNTSRDWNTSSNWCGGVPSLSSDIFIPSGTQFSPFIPSNLTGNCRNLNINENAIFVDSGILQITGTITNLGYFNASYGTSTVEFKGSSQQTIPTSVPYINNLKINNGSGVTLETNLTVGGHLTLTNGIINVNYGNQLIMLENATASGGSNASHVSGKILKRGSAGFLFPIGREGKYAPCGLSGFGTSEDFTAEYFKKPYSNLNKVGLSKVSGKECWLINHLTSGNVGTNLSLYSYDTAFSGISNFGSTNNLIVAHFNSANQYWEDLGGMKSIINLPGGGLEVNMSVSTFSPFTFGSPNGLNALPVKLINFVAIPDNITKTVELNWETATEENSKYYEVLHSVDFVKWNSLGKVNSKGNGNLHNSYSFNHANPSLVNHYKLKEVANNGDYSYSEIKLAKFVDSPADKITIYPNPSSGSLTIANAGEDTNYEICDVTGKVIQSGNFNQSTEILNLPKGIYFVTLISEGNIQNEKVIVQ